MPRIKAAEGLRHGRSRGGASEVSVSGRSAPLTRAAVARAAGLVLAGERRPAGLSVNFVGRDRMRALNAQWLGKSRPTDVIAFSLRGPANALAGDIYICRWVAVREARTRRLPLRQELLRLVVHGVLHVLGYDHPEGDEREASAMWRRQERYVRRLA